MPAQPPPLPTELQVEVTGACNLRCRMCLVRYRPPLDRVSAAMSFDRFAELVDALPDLGRVTLQGLGEPLLAPDLLHMVEYAARRGIDVGFNTNGTLLTRRRSEQLVDAGLSWLHVSLDGATAATFEDIRERARFDRVRRNVQDLVEVIAERGAQRPDIELVFVAMRRNLHELVDVVRLAGEWGVGRLWVQNLSHSFSDTDPAGSYADIRAYAEAEALWVDGDDRSAVELAFAGARAVSERNGVELRLPSLGPEHGVDGGDAPRREPGTPGCDWPWRSAYVTHDGSAQPCCMVMGSDRAVLGDVGRQSLADIWRGEAYEAFRTALCSDDPPEVCRGCSMYRRVF